MHHNITFYLLFWVPYFCCHGQSLSIKKRPIPFALGIELRSQGYCPKLDRMLYFLAVEKLGKEQNSEKSGRISEVWEKWENNRFLEKNRRNSRISYFNVITYFFRPTYKATTDAAPLPGWSVVQSQNHCGNDKLLCTWGLKSTVTS